MFAIHSSSSSSRENPMNSNDIVSRMMMNSSVQLVLSVMQNSDVSVSPSNNANVFVPPMSMALSLMKR